ncbi:MAG: RNA polymerase sigma-70 factor [Bacteroidales bacterium]|nr:RNA polymerase sigma-70 factor [Bacteroidales bacterium]
MFTSQTKLDLKDGNPEAFREVFRLLYPRLKGYCRLYITNKNEVEDIIQESFLILWEHRNSIDVCKRIESFLFVIARNRCLNYLKSKRLNSGSIQIEDYEFSELQYLYQLDLVGREEKSMEEMLIESFQQAVDELPSKMKTVFIRCKLKGEKQKAVAEELGISQKMVEKHISKAKAHIHDKMLSLYPTMGVMIVLLLG